ncbi:hypothetical protein YC2023_092899 [Brassica napus]
MEEQRASGLTDSVVQFQNVGSRDGCEAPHKWSSNGGGKKIDVRNQIFCNRSLNMKNIIAVGFDMDYTLAQYKSETFESLAYEGTVRKLVYDLGYPRELLEWTFDWNYMVRGLVLDKKKGNILKMDRHKYVKVAYHGFKELSKQEKVDVYGTSLVRDSFDEPDYALIDTLFSLAEAYLFAQLVDFKDNNPDKIPKDVDYARMYKDVRSAVDMCHRDGTLKQMVAKNPNKYINEDATIVPLIKMIRDSGRSTFLVTNSSACSLFSIIFKMAICSKVPLLWDYTNIVMNFLCGGRTVHGPDTCNFDWLQYFDVVITGSAKPGFFHEESRANLFEVELKSGMLINTDNGTPMAQVLYVGDHIYGDILRSKKVLGWRTMLVVPELEKEVELLWELRDARKELILMRNERDSVEDMIHHLSWSLKFEDINEKDKQEMLSTLFSLHIFDLFLSTENDLDSRWEEATGEAVDEVIFLSRHTTVLNPTALPVHPIGVLHLKEGESPPQGGKPGWAALLLTVGFVTFFLSSILDNLSSTIVMVSLLRKLVPQSEYRKLLGAVVVIAANAGGAWTPIGDVTTTMLWIHGLGVLWCKRDEVRLNLQEAQRESHKKFHNVWGQLMKTGYQSSRFAHQVERFACLYTSQVSNLRLYSPDKYYRPSEDFMSHEFHLLPL